MEDSQDLITENDFSTLNPPVEQTIKGINDLIVGFSNADIVTIIHNK